MPPGSKPREERINPFEALWSRTEGKADRIRAFVELLPKVDLHAHLNGSISPILINHFIQLRAHDDNKEGGAQSTGTTGITPSADTLRSLGDAKSRMSYCFGIFDTVYSVVQTAEATRLVVQDMLLHYAAERTSYLEIRTSLRPLKDAPSLEEYLNVVRGAIRDVCSGSLFTVPGVDGSAEDSVAALYSEMFSGITMAEMKRRLVAMRVRLLVSINRGADVSRAEETVRILQKMDGEKTLSASPPIVGVDFSGNCYKNHFKDFVPTLEACRKLGLGITLHAGEKDDDAELSEMIEFHPSRFGHVVFAGGGAMDRIAEKRIPLEICLTSNLVTSPGKAWSVEDHHLFTQWFCVNAAATEAKEGKPASGIEKPSDRKLLRHPFSINTDDRGVFYTSMVDEWMIFADHLKPTFAPKAEPQMLKELCRVIWRLTEDALDSGFGGGADLRKELHKMATEIVS